MAGAAIGHADGRENKGMIMIFESFWKSYPHPKNRGSKAHAEELYGRLSITDRTDMLAGLERYSEYIHGSDWQNAMQAERWLNKKKKNWQSWAEAEKGEDADISQIRRETAALKERNARRQEAADEGWRDRFQRQFGHRPS